MAKRKVKKSNLERSPFGRGLTDSIFTTSTHQ